MPLAPLEQFEFHHVLDATPGASLVIFTGPGCGACRRLKAVLAAEERLFADLHLFEVDAQRDMALTREFGVFHLPAMFLYRDGKFHCEVHSEAEAVRLRAAVDAALTAPAQEAP